MRRKRRRGRCRDRGRQGQSELQERNRKAEVGGGEVGEWGKVSTMGTGKGRLIEEKTRLKEGAEKKDLPRN